MIISLTGIAFEEMRQPAIEAGCSDYLSKPFDHDELFQMIQRHLGVHYEYEKSKKLV